MKIYRFIGVCLLVLFVISLSGQESRVFNKEKLSEDLDYFYQQLSVYNPGLYALTSDAQYRIIIDSLTTQLEDKMTDLEFYPYMKYLGAATNEGHLTVGSLSDTISSVYSVFNDSSTVLCPVGIYFNGDKAFVRVNFSGIKELEPGMEILSINDEYIPELKKKLFNYTFSDGFINSSKYHSINRDFIFYYYWFIDQPDTFELQIKSHNGSIQQYSIPALNRNSIMENYIRINQSDIVQKPIKSNTFYRLDFLENNIAYLKLTSFHWRYIKQENINIKQVFKSIFLEIQAKGSKQLILDLRNNQGGRKEFIKELARYLQYEKHRGIMYTTISWKGKKKKYRIPRKSKLAFDGSLWVLINGLTFSNGSVAAMLAKELGKAVIIGEESGANYQGFTAGSVQRLSMPNTGIMVQIPRYYYDFTMIAKSQSETGRGVIPDHTIIPGIEAILNKNDVVLDSCLRMINESQF